MGWNSVTHQFILFVRENRNVQSCACHQVTQKFLNRYVIPCSMLEKSIYYVVTTMEEAARYRTNTLLFSAGGQQLRPYDKLAKAREIALSAGPSSPKKLPLVLRFELPKMEGVPNQLSFRDASQAGYDARNIFRGHDHRGRPIYFNARNGLKHLSRIDDWNRLSMVPLDSMETDISPKLRFMDGLCDYAKRIARFMESATEYIGVDGRLEEECMSLSTRDYNTFLGGHKDSIRKKYGFTVGDQGSAELASAVFFEFGKRLAREMKRVGSQTVLVPGTESLLQVGCLMERVNALAEARKNGEFILSVNGREPTVEEALEAFLAMAGADPSMTDFAQAELRRRQAGRSETDLEGA